MEFKELWFYVILHTIRSWVITVLRATLIEILITYEQLYKNIKVKMLATNHVDEFSHFCTMHSFAKHTDTHINHTACNICSKRQIASSHWVLVMRSKNNIFQVRLTVVVLALVPLCVCVVDVCDTADDNLSSIFMLWVNWRGNWFLRFFTFTSAPPSNSISTILSARTHAHTSISSNSFKLLSAPDIH